MKLTVSKVLVLVLAGSEVAVASSWFTKTGKHDANFLSQTLVAQ